MLRSRNYLFAAPAPSLSIISAPAPAIYCHLKLFYTVTVEISFSSSKLTAENVYLNLFSAPAPAPGHQIISAPPAPAPQHCMDREKGKWTDKGNRLQKDRVELYMEMVSGKKGEIYS